MRRVTVEDIVTFIEANPRRKNPGAPKKIGGSQGKSCIYFHPYKDTPSCVIGNVVARVSEVPNHILSSRFSDNADVDSYAEFFADDAAAELAHEIQQFADEGHTWGKALEMARAELRLEDSNA